MKHLFSLLFLFTLSVLSAQSVQSPSGKITLNFKLGSNGQPVYAVNYKNKAVVLESALGIKLKEKPALDANFEILDSKTATFNESWKPVLGEQASIVNHYNELTIGLVSKESKVKMNIIFRVFDEGVAFRYDFPRQAELNYFIISDEATQFNLTENNKVFWLPGDFDSNEYEYNETKLSEIDNSKINMNNGIGVKSIPGRYMVQTPLMMKSPSGLYLNIFEAAVVNYPVMHLKADVTNFKLKAELVPNAIGDKAYLQAPCVSPWRTIMISDDARDIVGSRMILNLNEPSKIEDTSWIKPMKYVGIWWEMHVGKSTWDYAGSQNATNFGTKLESSGRHGATTENTKRYIDFAAKNGFDGVLVEGWNVGWEDWSGNWKEEVFDFTTPYPDFDLAAISAYAKSKNVKMIMHHETSGSVGNYERHLDRALDLMKKYDYPAAKTGYVGKIIPRGEFHDGQAMVNHFNFVARRFADYKLMLNSHESSRPTGYSRTYPNYVAAEAARGTEFNAWSIGNPPMHETILPFTRLLGGPMDYTPGIFEMDIMGGKAAPACGWAMGMERVLELMKVSGSLPEPQARCDIFVLHQGGETLTAAMIIAERLRSAGIDTILFFPPDGQSASFKSQMKKADASGATFAVIIGPDELAKNEAQIKDLRASGEQKSVPLDGVLEAVIDALVGASE